MKDVSRVVSSAEALGGPSAKAGRRGPYSRLTDCCFTLLSLSVHFFSPLSQNLSSSAKGDLINSSVMSFLANIEPVKYFLDRNHLSQEFEFVSLIGSNPSVVFGQRAAVGFGKPD